MKSNATEISSSCRLARKQIPLKVYFRDPLESHPRCEIEAAQPACKAYNYSSFHPHPRTVLFCNLFGVPGH